MAATHFKKDCPYCGTKGAGFEYVFRRRRRGSKDSCEGLAVCGVCDRGMITNYTDLTARNSGHPFDLVGNSIDFPGEKFHVVSYVPTSSGEIPERLPSNVAAFFGQGVANEKSENWDAAGAMFRKSLDVATKIKDPASASKKLFKRIEDMKESGLITADLATWAHEIRIEGNSSVHDDEPETPEDVAAIHEFTRAFLLYTFTLPSLVTSRASADSPEE